MNLDQLLERAGMDRSELPVTLEDADRALRAAITEVAAVRQQLNDERAVSTNRSKYDPNWPYAARRAARALQHRVNVLKNRKAILDNEQARKRAQEKLARISKNNRAAEIARQHSAEKARAHNERQKSEAEVTLRALKDYIRSMPEKQREPFYEVMQAAQSAFRAANAASQ
jgi:hypothetical protein